MRLPELSQNILRLALPVFFGTLSQTIFYAADTVMLGRIGVEAVAAAGLGWFVVWIFGSSLMAIEVGTQSLTARWLGKGDWEACGALLDNTLIFSLSAGLLFSISGYLLAPFIFPYLSNDAKVVQYGIDYLRFSFLSVIFFLIISAFRGFFDGLGQTRLFMKTALIMNISNIALDYVLIFGAFGFPRLEVKGAAIASLASSIIGAACFFGFAMSNGFVKRFRCLNFYSIKPSVLIAILKISFPAMLRVFFTMTGLTVFLWITGRAGTVELAASNIMMTMSSFTFLLCYGFAVAAATIVGQRLGMENPLAAEQGAWAAMKLCLIGVSLLSAAFIIFPELALEIFTDQSAIIERSAGLMLLFGIIQVLDAAGLILSHALQGAGWTGWVMKTEGLIVCFMFLPSAYLLGVTFKFGIYGAWLSMFFYSLMFSAAMFIKFKSGKWKETEI